MLRKFTLLKSSPSLFRLSDFGFARKQGSGLLSPRRKSLVADDFGQDPLESDDDFIEDDSLNNSDPSIPVTDQSKNNSRELVVNKSELMLSLPKTKFNPRFKPTYNEERQHWKMSTNLYRWQQQRHGENVDPKKQYVIHDLPFSTYGEPHLGHFYNKTQQDIAGRFAMLNGVQVSHQIGFNLHGSTVQNQALLDYHKTQDELRRYSPEETRKIAKKYAENNLKKTINSMARWGLMTDFASAYTTNHPFYESGVVQAFKELVDSKSIFVDEKPCLWSCKHRTSLDDDEATMELIPKLGTFIKFQVHDFGKNLFLANLAKEKQCDVFVVGFSTELWTLNSLRALSLNENVAFGIYEFNDALYIVSRNRYKHHRLFFKEQGSQLVSTQTGLQISQLLVHETCFERVIPIITSDKFAENEQFGSGISCICPGHNSKDFQIAETYGLSKNAHVTALSTFDNTMPDDLKGLSVASTQASDAILQIYQDNNQTLDISESRETECYFSKLTREPLIVRTQQSIYSRLPKFEREYYVENLQSQNKIGGGRKGKQSTGVFGTLENTILEKSDNWTISSNNDWGIPIPILFESDGTPFINSSFIEHVSELFMKHGSEIWFSSSVADLLPAKLKNKASSLEKGNFVFDQWFESGCSWYVMLKSNETTDLRSQLLIEKTKSLLADSYAKCASPNPDDEDAASKSPTPYVPEEASSTIVKKYPCDLSIQGKDQIDSWLLSTSLLSIGLREDAFFQRLKLHRIVPATEDEKLSKLSKFKSSMDDLIEGSMKLNGQRQYGYGVDILRMWVALSDSVRSQVNETKQQSRRKSAAMAKQQALELAENSDYLFLRANEFDLSNNYVNMIRKTMWQLLGSLNGYEQVAIDQTQSQSQKMQFVHDFMMTQLVLYMKNMHSAYSRLDYSTAVDLAVDFVKNWVLDFYIDATKKSIIASPNQTDSQHSLFIYSKIVENILISIAPILPHNAEEIFSHIGFKRNKCLSVFHQDWPEINREDLRSFETKIEVHNLLWDLRLTIWEQLSFQMQRYQNIREKERYDVVIVTDDVFSKGYQILQDTCLDSLDSFIGAGAVKVHTVSENAQYPHKNISTFKFKGSLRGVNQPIEYTIKIYLAGQFKCVRCLKFTASAEKTICPHCIQYLTDYHKEACNTLLLKLKRNPQTLIEVSSAPSIKS